MKKFLQKIKFDKWKAWIYLLPAIVLLLVFTVWPIINTVKMAFTVYWDQYQLVDFDGDLNLLVDIQFYSVLFGFD